MAMLTVENLEASYGAVRALHGISIEVAEGELVALLGVNGVAMVAHGSSSPRAIENALRAAAHMVDVELRQHLADALQRSRGWLPGTKRGTGQGI